MEPIEEIHQRNIDLLNQCGVSYQSWEHEPIVDVETDKRVSRQLRQTATLSKSLFLKIKGGGFAVYLTETGRRLDSKAMKAILGKRVNISSDEDMTAEIGCRPGAVCPFGLPEHVQLVVDKNLFEKEELMYTPGLPTATFAITGKDLFVLLEKMPNVTHVMG